MVEFWKNALNYVPGAPANDNWIVLLDPNGKEPNLSFQARNKRPARRSWRHPDLYTDNYESEVERLVKLEATRYPWRYAPGADYVVLEGPEVISSALSRRLMSRTTLNLAVNRTCARSRAGGYLERQAAQPLIRVTPIDHRVLEITRKVHAIQIAAYKQEAVLLGAIHFPPLERTVADIGDSTEEFLGAYIGDDLVGTLSTRPDRKDQGINIASLVVNPACQRKGVARELMRKAVAQHPGSKLTVQTGAKNTPAIALYEKFGFVEYRRWLVGREPMELVEFRRPTSVPCSAA